VTMDSPSQMDPLHDFAPTRMIGGFYGTFDWTLPLGRQVKDYVAEAEAVAARTQKVRRIKSAKPLRKASY